MTATVARKKAAAMIAEVEKGNDPAAAKDDERKATALKFDKAAALYLSMKESEVRGSSLKITRLYLTGPYFTKLHSMRQDHQEPRQRSSRCACFQVGQVHRQSCKAASGGIPCLVRFVWPF
jgi:hypothetical protein